MKMEDTTYFKGLNNFIDTSSIVNNIFIQGETSDLNVFTKRLLELGFGYVVAKSIKYEGNLLNKSECLNSYLLNFKI